MGVVVHQVRWVVGGLLCGAGFMVLTLALLQSL